jgi:hypothetical protein
VVCDAEQPLGQYLPPSASSHHAGYYAYFIAEMRALLYSNCAERPFYDLNDTSLSFNPSGTKGRALIRNLKIRGDYSCSTSFAMSFRKSLRKCRPQQRILSTCFRGSVATSTTGDVLSRSDNCRNLNLLFRNTVTYLNSKKDYSMRHI